MRYREFGQKHRKSRAEPWIKRVALRGRGALQQIGAPDGREPFILIIGKAQTNAEGPRRRCEEAAQILHRAPVAIGISVELPGTECGQIRGKMFGRSSRPGVGSGILGIRRRLSGHLHQPLLALQIGVPDSEGHTVTPKRPGQPRRPSRSLAGLRRRRVDEEDSFFHSRSTPAWASNTYKEIGKSPHASRPLKNTVSALIPAQAESGSS